jgi:hypothetical protein
MLKKDGLKSGKKINLSMKEGTQMHLGKEFLVTCVQRIDGIQHLLLGTLIGKKGILILLTPDIILTLKKVTMNNYDYPDGSDNSYAPWNEVEQDGELVEVTISQTLSKQVEVEVNDYEVDWDYDDDGNKIPELNLTNCDLITPTLDQYWAVDKILKELPKLYDEFSKFDLGNSYQMHEFKYKLLHLAENAKGWTEDETEVVL